MKNHTTTRGERVPSSVLMGRIRSFLTSFCALTWLLAAGPSAVAQDGGMFRYRDREGRLVYTNLAGMASHGRALEQLSLPPLSSIDFEHTAPEQLRQIDSQVKQTHSALQAGEHCEAIRKSSRIPLRTRIWTDHYRKLYVAAGLLAFSMLLGHLGARRRLGSLWPIAPLVGCAFLGYATFKDTRAAIQALTSGLRACSEPLPEGQSDDAPAVKNRLSRALDIRSSIYGAYDQQAREIEAIMRER
jgi:hypothetical protein